MYHDDGFDEMFARKNDAGFEFAPRPDDNLAFDLADDLIARKIDSDYFENEYAFDNERSDLENFSDAGADNENSNF